MDMPCTWHLLVVTINLLGQSIIVFTQYIHHVLTLTMAFIPSLQTPLHSLGQDDQNKVQHDVLVM